MRSVRLLATLVDLRDSADHVFFKKSLSAEFGKLPYKEEKNGLTWDVPK